MASTRARIERQAAAHFASSVTVGQAAQVNVDFWR
jgi:hypothetical protein